MGTLGARTPPPEPLAAARAYTLGWSGLGVALSLSVLCVGPRVFIQYV